MRFFATAMPRLVRRAGALALGAFAVSAAALPAGSAGGAGDIEALQLMHKLAQCAVKDHRPSAVEMLAYPPRSAQSERSFFKTDPGECMGDNDGELHMKDHFLRGAIAERLLRQDFSAAGTFTGKSLPRIFAWPTAKAFQALKPESKLDLTMIRVGECTAKAAPREVYALFGNPIRSQGEATAIRALVPTMQSCIPQGASVDLNLATARAYLGEGAYRVFVQQAAGRGAVQ